MAITKEQVSKSLAVLHPNLYLKRLEERLTQDGASIVDVLFEIALRADKAEDKLKAIDKIAKLAGIEKYMETIAIQAARLAVVQTAPTSDDDVPAVADANDPGDASPSDVERYRELGGDDDEHRTDPDPGDDREGAGERPRVSEGVHGGGAEGPARR